MLNYKCVEIISTIQETTAHLFPKSHSVLSRGPFYPIQNEICLRTVEKAVINHEKHAQKAQVNSLYRSVIYQLNECRNEQLGDTLESGPSGPVAVNYEKREMLVPTHSAPWQPAVSVSGKADALGDSFEAQIQPVDVQSDPAGDERVLCPASEPTITNLSEVLQAIQGLTAGMALSPKRISNRILRYLPLRALTFLTIVFKADLCRQYLPPARKHPRLVSIQKPAKDPALPSSYRHIKPT